MILIDERQGSGELAPYISAPKVVCRLEYADFALDGNGPEGAASIGIERKGVMDMLQSMTSGRLSGHQLIGLKQEYDFVYLLVEGMWRPDRHTGVLMRTNGRGRWVAASQGNRRFMARDVFCFLQSLQTLCGVMVIQTSNRWETGKWLDSIHGWWQKKWTDHKSHLQWHQPTTYASLRKPNLVTRMASQIDGVGWDKARKMGEVFKDPLDLVTATEDELKSVDGIGKKMAESIIKQLEE